MPTQQPDLRPDDAALIVPLDTLVEAVRSESGIKMEPIDPSLGPTILAASCFVGTLMAAVIAWQIVAT